MSYIGLLDDATKIHAITCRWWLQLLCPSPIIFSSSSSFIDQPSSSFIMTTPMDSLCALLEQRMRYCKGQKDMVVIPYRLQGYLSASKSTRVHCIHIILQHPTNKQRNMIFSSTCLILNVAHRPVHHSTIHDCLDDDHAYQDPCDLSAALYAMLCYSRSGMHPLLSSSNRLPQLLHQRGWTRYHLSAQLVLLDNSHNKYWNMQHGYYCLPSTVHSMAAIRDRLDTDTILQSISLRQVEVHLGINRSGSCKQLRRHSGSTDKRHSMSSSFAIDVQTRDS